MKEFHEELQYLPRDNEGMDNKQLWGRIRSEMKIKTTKLSYDTWIEPLRLDHIDNDSAIVYLSWPKQEKLINHINDHYNQQLEAAFCRILKEDYRVVIKPAEESGMDELEVNRTESSFIPVLLYLNKEYTFDHFFHNDTLSAKIAPYAAKAVAEHPIRDFNPLVICGGFGTGKTHLLQAIGNEIIKTNKTAKVLILSADYFISQYEDTRERNLQDSFRNKITSADCLLVDDIQLLRDMRYQRAFIYVFDSYYCQNKPIVLTSDENPEALLLMSNSLKERLGWGLVTMLELPDHETRKQILKDTIERLGIEKSDELMAVVDYIANKSYLTPRDVKASMKKVLAVSKILGNDINVENAEMILRDMYTPQTA